PLSPDWVYSNQSNVHVAKDKGWFTTYTPFDSKVGCIYHDGTSKVVGIGTVTLSVNRAPRLKGSESHNTIVLNDVLHVPSFLSNVIAMHAVGFNHTWACRKGLFDKNGRYIAYFDPKCTFDVLKLSGPPVGPVVGRSIFLISELERRRVHYLVNATWSNEEYRRWKHHQQAEAYAGNTPYTKAERAWIRRHFRSEFHFLLSYGLKIYDEEDHLEGRAIARALMEDSEDE
ncbi:hypothetical protein P152DRAFT_382703, partial [Eremomyces bilateralis CBS 781.70]